MTDNNINTPNFVSLIADTTHIVNLLVRLDNEAKNPNISLDEYKKRQTAISFMLNQIPDFQLKQYIITLVNMKLNGEFITINDVLYADVCKSCK